MASCITEQWTADAPQVKLTVTEQSSTSTEITLSWKLQYISEYPAYTNYEKAYTVRIGGTIVDSGYYDIDEKTGTKTIVSGTHVIAKTSSTKKIDFDVSFAINLYWNDNDYAGTLTASGSLNIDPVTVYTNCGAPTGLSIRDNGDNSVYFSCLVGDNGSNNTVSGLEFFMTFDGTDPSPTNYGRTERLMYYSAGGTAKHYVYFDQLSSVSAIKLFGSTCKCTVKLAIRTLGSAGSKYSSSFVTASIPFTWFGKTAAPNIITPKKSETAGLLTSYRLSWEAGNDGINNPVKKYIIYINNLTTGEVVAEYTTTKLYYDIPASCFAANNTYTFDVYTQGECIYVTIPFARSGRLTVKPIAKLSSPAIVLSDGNTVPSIDISGYKEYVNIGSGNVLKLSWGTPTAANNAVDYYTLSLSKYDVSSSSYISLFSNDIGNVNEFYINSEHLENTNTSNYQLQISLVAHSKYGKSYDSATSIITTNISNGCGTYTKVGAGYKQPVMKRALAFTKLDYVALTDANGKALVDEEGKALYAQAARAQSSESGWALMQEFSSKDSNGVWKNSDIRYEVLTDANGEIITDSNNEPIYVL